MPFQAGEKINLGAVVAGKGKKRKRKKKLNRASKSSGGHIQGIVSEEQVSESFPKEKDTVKQLIRKGKSKSAIELAKNTPQTAINRSNRKHSSSRSMSRVSKRCWKIISLSKPKTCSNWFGENIPPTVFV